MDDLSKIPSTPLMGTGKFTIYFKDRGISTLREAAYYVHNLPYGYNSNYEDPFILFKEGKGTCTSKHAVIAALAEENHVPLHKHVGIYIMKEDIMEGASLIAEKYHLPYLLMVHCFLVLYPSSPSSSHSSYEAMFDLTAGNKNGKKRPIELDDMIYHTRVDPFISRKDEYLLFRKVINEKLQEEALPGVNSSNLMDFLKARSEALEMLKKHIKDLNGL